MREEPNDLLSTVRRVPIASTERLDKVRECCRLRWIMYVENNMFDLERRLNLYHDGLKRLRRRLNVVQQIHLAPSMYLTAVGEVVRRRTFSQAFLMVGFVPA